MTTIYGVKEYYEYDRHNFIGHFFKPEMAQNLINSKMDEELIKAKQRLQEYKDSLSPEELSCEESIYIIASRLVKYFEYLRSKMNAIFDKPTDFIKAYHISKEDPNVVLYKSYKDLKKRLANQFEEKYVQDISYFTHNFNVENYIKKWYALIDIEVV